MSIAEANRKYFDSVTDHYDKKPFMAKVNEQVTDALRNRLDWIGIPFANTGSADEAENVRLLDYACGTGLMSRIFGPYVTVTRGMDLSPNMVATYNARARTADLPASTINAVVGDLFNKEAASSVDLSKPEWNNFDLAAVGFAFHHFEDVVHAARCLKERLRPGGVLIINDFMQGGDMLADENDNPIPGTEGDHAHDHMHGKSSQGHDGKEGHHGHHHHGDGAKKGENDDPSIKFREDMTKSIVIPHFTLEYLKRVFTEAGLVNVDVVTMEQKVFMDFSGQKLWRTILFAKGIRPLEEKSEL